MKGNKKGEQQSPHTSESPGGVDVHPGPPESLCLMANALLYFWRPMARRSETWKVTAPTWSFRTPPPPPPLRKHGYRDNITLPDSLSSHLHKVSLLVWHSHQSEGNYWPEDSGDLILSIFYYVLEFRPWKFGSLSITLCNRVIFIVFLVERTERNLQGWVVIKGCVLNQFSNKNSSYYSLNRGPGSTNELSVLQATLSVLPTALWITPAHDTKLNVQYKAKRDNSSGNGTS